MRFPRHFSRAFTLLEVCLSVFIILMIVGVALPGLARLSEKSTAEASFEAFDALARQARRLSGEERCPYELVWEKGAILLRREGGEEPVDTLAYDKQAIPGLQLPAALRANPPAVWTFWPGGLCEPAVVTLEAGRDGWSAVYNPFTARPSVTYGITD